MLKRILPTLMISVLMMAGASAVHAQLMDGWDVWDTSCDVFRLLEQLDDGLGFRVQNYVTGKTYTVKTLALWLNGAMEADGVTGHTKSYVSYQFQENGVRGVGRMTVDYIMPDLAVSTDLPFTWEMTIVTGNRYKKGGAGGSAVQDLVTGAVTYDPGNFMMVLCR